MSIDDFRHSLLTHFDEFRRVLATDAGDWVVKGFIDVYRNVYTIMIWKVIGSGGIASVGNERAAANISSEDQA